jgi:DDE superfamily endonuclease
MPPRALPAAVPLLLPVLAALASASSAAACAHVFAAAAWCARRRRRVRVPRPLAAARLDWWSAHASRLEEAAFARHFRMGRAHLAYLARLLQPDMHRCRGLHRVPALEATALLVYRLSSPASCREIGVLFGRARSSVCELTEWLAGVVVRRLGRLVRCPQTPTEWADVNRRWRAQGNCRIPGACGAIDCTQIRIWKPPRRDLRAFFNRKNWTSYNIQAVCDERMLWLNVLPGFPGSAHDAGILARSSFYRLAAATVPQNHFILADSGYPLRQWQLTPYKEMDRGAPLDAAKRHYNQCHSSTRVVVERAFGLLKARWRKLYMCDMRNQRTISLFISCAFILHNYVEMLLHNYADINPAFERWPAAPRRADPLPLPPTPDEHDAHVEQRDGIADYIHTFM